MQTGPGLKWQFDRMGSCLMYVSGSVDHRGKLVQDIKTAELKESKKRFRQESVETLAVVGKFSTRNSDFERRVKAYFADEYDDITMGHSLSGKLNFPDVSKRRISMPRSLRRFGVSLKDHCCAETEKHYLLHLPPQGGRRHH